jgi:hypothetical protein
MDTTHETPAVEWRPDLEQVIQRHRDWFEGKRKFLVTVIPNQWDGFNWDLHIDIKSAKPVESYDFSDDEQLYAFLSYRLEQFETYWRVKTEWGLDDDFVPVFEPRLGWAEVVAPFVREAKVSYYAQTSQLEPVIEDYGSFDWSRLDFNSSNEGARILTKMNQWCKEMGKGHFLVQARGLDANPSDTAKALRGDALFVDFMDHPAEVHRLMAKTTQMVIQLIEHQRQVIGGPTLGGYGTTWHGGYWTPGTIIGHLGDNVCDLVSGLTFDQFIVPYLKQFVVHFGGCVFGRDVSTRQVWGSLRKLGNVLAFKPRNVGSRQVTVEDIRVMCSKTEGLPLFLQTFSSGEFNAKFSVARELGIQVFFVCQCRDREEAARIINGVRSLA